MRLRTAGLVVFGITALWAQEAIPPAPIEPLLPTSAEQCSAFRDAYSKVIQKMHEASGNCIVKTFQTPGWTVNVPPTLSCIEAGHAVSVRRLCAKYSDQYCRAELDQNKKVAACMAKVEEYEMKIRIAKAVAEEAAKALLPKPLQAVLPKKPEPEKTSTNDEIGRAFEAVDKAREKLTGQQPKVVQKVDENGVRTIKAIEREAFSELDKAFRDADFAELTRATKPASTNGPGSNRSASATHPSQDADLAAALNNTKWVERYQDDNQRQSSYPNYWERTYSFGQGNKVIQEVREIIDIYQGRQMRYTGIMEHNGQEILIRWTGVEDLRHDGWCRLAGEPCYQAQDPSEPQNQERGKLDGGVLVIGLGWSRPTRLRKTN